MNGQTDQWSRIESAGTNPGVYRISAFNNAGMSKYGLFNKQ